MSFRRYLVASGIVALGCAGAMPFYHSSTEAIVADRTEPPPVTLPLLESGTDRGTSAAVGEEAGVGGDSARVSLGRPESPGRHTRSSDVPPRMAATFDDAVGSRLRWAAREAPMRPAVAGRVASLPASPEEPHTRGSVGSAVVSSAEADRLHVVRDGDSLERLARHYYGSERYAAFLYSVNQAVLRSPQLLPIGAELRIPARPPALSSLVTDNGGSADGASRDRTRREDAGGLVPVAWQ